MGGGADALSTQRAEFAQGFGGGLWEAREMRCGIGGGVEGFPNVQKSTDEF
jgi:hypothetical protein